MESPSKKKILIPLLVGGGILAFLFLIFIGGTAYAWTSNENVPLFSEVVEAAEQITWDASKNENKLVSSMFSPAVSLTSTDGEAPTSEELQKFFSEDAENYHSYDYDLTLFVKSEVEGSSSEAATFEGEFTFSMKGDVSNVDETLLLNSEISGEYKAEGTTLTGEGEMRIVDKTLYAKADSLPTFGTTQFDKYQGQWYEQDISDYLDQLYAEENQDEVDEEMLQDIYEVMTSENVLNNIEKTPDQIFGEVRAHCYKLDMDGEEIAQVLKDLDEATEDNSEENTLFPGYTDEEIEEIADSYESLIVEWCVGRRDGLPYKYVVEILLNDDLSDSLTTIRVDLKMSNYNKDVTVEKPTDTKTFDELYEELFGSSPVVEDDSYYDDYYYDGYYYDEEFNYEDYQFDFEDPGIYEDDGYGY